jgi:hypothetical protein
MQVKLLNYDKVTFEFTSQKSRTLLSSKYNAYWSTYCADTDTLYLHLTRELIAPTDILTLNVGVTDRVVPP